MVMRRDRRNRSRLNISEMEWYLIAILTGIILAAAITVLLESGGLKRSEMDAPDFSSIEDAGEKKEAFFQFLLPYVNELNAALMQDRNRVLNIRKRIEEGNRISKRDRKWIQEKYRAFGFQEPVNLDSEKFFTHLLTRVDAIPPSLALAQAANESGWGTSRFAREGNNYYGIWCFEPGCGMIPRRRPPGATYEVTRYTSIEDSIADYFHKLNTGRSYLQFRLIRRQLRDRGEPITGIPLADGLERYSERGLAYVRDIQNLIRNNDLQVYDI